MVRNNIDAIQTTTHMDDSEFQVLNLKKKLVNLYAPNDKALSLNALPAVEDHYLLLVTSTVIHRAGDMTT